MWSSPLFWIVFAIVLFWALGAYNRLMRMRSAVVQSFGSFDAHMVRLVALLGEFHAACTVQREDTAAPVDQELAALQGAATQLSASLAVARARPLRPGAIAALAAARDVLHASWPAALRKVQDAAAATATAAAQATQAAAPVAAPTAGTPIAGTPTATAAEIATSNYKDTTITADTAAVLPPAREDGSATTGTTATAADAAAALMWPVRWSDHVQQNDQAIAVFNDAVAHYNAAIAQFPASVLAWAFGFKAARGL